MNTMPSSGQKICSDCKRVHCKSGCNCDCHWEPWAIIMSNVVITQDTCQHDARVKMPGYNDLYECTRCHKFISIIISK